jgi:hypothetical protein
VINGSFAPNTPWLQGALAVVIVVVASILVAEVEAVELLDVVPNPLLLMLLNNTTLLPATNVVRRGILLPAAPPTLAVCLLVALSQALLLLGNVRALRRQPAAAQPLPKRGSLPLAPILEVLLVVVVNPHVMLWYAWHALYVSSTP